MSAMRGSGQGTLASSGVALSNTPSSPHVSWVWTAIFVVSIVIIIFSTIVQRFALNKIAFGRSMFISWAAILIGFLIALLPSIAATIVAVAMFILGIGFMALMGLKSYQRLVQKRRTER